MLPCKPDHAQRDVRLGAIDVPMQMLGCEAGDGLYAVSRIHIADPSQLTVVHAAWRQAAMSNMRARDVQHRYLSIPKAAAGIRPLTSQRGGTLPAIELEVLIAQGSRPDGSKVQAHMTWFANGMDIYHIAAYSNTLNREGVELLFSDLKLQ